MKNFKNHLFQIITNCSWYLLLTLVFLLIVSTNSFAVEQNKSTVFYKSEGLWVVKDPWSTLEDWCMFGSDPKRGHGVYVFYDVPHDQRLEKMDGGYEAFVQNKVVPAINKVCGPDFVVYNVIMGMYRQQNGEFDSNLLIDYMKGKITPLWDSFTFKINETGAILSKYTPEEAKYHITQAEIDTLTPNKVAFIGPQEAHQVEVATSQRKDVWGLDRCNGEFCDLPGGLYLNAIYNNDIDLIKELDRTINITGAKLIPTVSLLAFAAEEYMDYSSNPFSTRFDLVSKTFTPLRQNLWVTVRLIRRRLFNYQKFSSPTIDTTADYNSWVKKIYQVPVSLAKSICTRELLWPLASREWAQPKLVGAKQAAVNNSVTVRSTH